MGLGWLAGCEWKDHPHLCKPVVKDDASIFDEPLVSANGQQLWESLAILVAIDIWASQWAQSRVVLKVRGDTVGALTLLLKMRPANSKQAVIARELSLRLIELSFPPDAVHTPGVSHFVADKLSRIFSPIANDGYGGVRPTSNALLHPALERATETTAPRRNATW